MTDAETSFWTPTHTVAIVGVVLLIVTLAWLASLPQNKFERGDLLAPNPGYEISGHWMITSYDQKYDKYHLYVALDDRTGTYEWDREYDLWMFRTSAEEIFTVIGMFSAWKW